MTKTQFLPIFLGRRYARSQYFWVQTFQGIHVFGFEFCPPYAHSRIQIYEVPPGRKSRKMPEGLNWMTGVWHFKSDNSTQKFIYLAKIPPKNLISHQKARKMSKVLHQEVISLPFYAGNETLLLVVFPQLRQFKPEKAVLSWQNFHHTVKNT